MKRKDKVLIVIAIAGMILSIFGGLTYAFFTAGVEGNSEAKNAVAETGVELLKYDGTNIISLEDALPGATHEINFSVENTGTLDTKYQIDINDVANTFVNDELIYSLTSNDGQVNISNKVMPSQNTTLVEYITIGVGEKQEYTLTLHFKETGSNQNANQGATFAGLIQINNLSESNILAKEMLRKSQIVLTEPDFKTSQTGDALYKTEDDLGTSYYYRGNVENNYIDLGTKYTTDITFYFIGLNKKSTLDAAYSYDYDSQVEACNDIYQWYDYKSAEECVNDIKEVSYKTGDKVLWRIVRVNGDDTIRLVTDTVIYYTGYADTNTDYTYVGYTSSNEKICTKSNPCDATTGISSKIKTYLDTWYADNLTGYDSYITLSDFCNDTSLSADSDDSWIGYKTYERLEVGSPSLKCTETTNNYGGYYRLKIGLLSADEINMAGYGYAGDEYQSYNVNNYLWSPIPFLSLSPDYTKPTSGRKGIFIAENLGSVLSEGATNSNGVRPVISLSSGIKITGGNGTRENPYTIN